MLIKSLRKYWFALLIATALFAGPTFADHLQKAITIAHSIPILEGKSLKVSSLSGGLTNHIYLLQTTDNQKYVLRIFGPEAESLGIDPAAQAAIALQVGSLEVGPKVVYLSPDSKHTLFEFVSGQPLTKDSFSPQARTALVQKLRILHDNGKFSTKFDPFVTASGFRQTALRKPANIVTSFPLTNMQYAASKIRIIQQHLAAVSQPYMRAGHNDLHRENILYDPKQNTLAIIDLDYAGSSDLFFDLGILANSLELNQQETKELLAAYFNNKDPNQKDYAHLALMRMVSTYWNAMWYFSQVGSSTIPHDYLQSGKDSLNAFLQQANSSEFRNWLEDLA